MGSFVIFATRYQQPSSLPISIGLLCCFITYLHEKNSPPNSITQTISGLSYAHKIKNITDFTHSFTVRQLLVSLHKQNPNVTDKRLPITEDILFKLLDNLGILQIGNYEIVLFKAMMMLAFTFALRAGEMTHSRHNLELNQIMITNDKLSVEFKSFKHSKNDPEVHDTPRSDKKYCVVQAMLEYLSLRGNLAGPLFKNKGKPISKHKFAEVLNQLCISCKLSSIRYTPHSLRIGSANHWLALNYSDNQIMRMGRWRSNALLVYLRGVVTHH